MDVTPRVAPQEIRSKVQSGEALLVCAYDDEEKCRNMRLEKSMTLQQFQEVQPSVPKNKDIVFYCA